MYLTGNPIPSPAGSEHPSWGALSARLGYVVILCLATLLPFGFDPSPAAVLERLGNATSPALVPRDAVDAARNIALFAGWGTLWLVTSNSTRTRNLLAGATLSGALLSGTLESIQLLSGIRWASVLDVFTNTTGAFIGALLTVFMLRALRHRRQERTLLGPPALVFAAGYGCAAIIEAFLPALRQNVLPGVHGGATTRFLAAIHHFELASLGVLPWMEGLLFVPAGVVLVMALYEERMSIRSGAQWAILVGVCLIAAAEVGHGVVGYPIQVGPALVHAAGFVIGGLAAFCLLPNLISRRRGRRRLIIAGAVYASVLLTWSWRPLDLTLHPKSILAQFTLDQLIPLRAAAIRNDLFSVADLTELFLLYLPVGALLAVRPARRTGAFSGVLPGLYLACLAELGQLLVGSRFFDVTGILVSAGGVGIGWSVTRRAGYSTAEALFPGDPIPSSARD